MKSLNYFVTLIVVSFSYSNSQAEARQLNAEEYKVIFTNPECQDYLYAAPVLSNSNKQLTQKPKNTFCTLLDISTTTRANPNTPHRQLVDWIRDPATREIFFAYLSFSNGAIQKEICKAIEERGVKVTFVLDRNTSKATANKLLSCKPPADFAANTPKLYERGHDTTLGIAHNKIFIVNPSGEKMKIAFGSANMSVGTILHHENWNFVTVPRASYFAQVHLCLMNGMIDHFSSKREFSEFVTQCRGKISVPEEEDIKVFLVPGEGGQAMNAIATQLRKSQKAYFAAHKFSYSRLLAELDRLLSAESNKPEVKLVIDDDALWAYKKQPPFGNSTALEFLRVSELSKKGLEVRYMETNGKQNILHHNKFGLFLGHANEESAVFTGAGNFTGSAFTDNFENFYLIKIPEVVKAYEEQYEHLWNQLASSHDDMPQKNVLPPNSGETLPDYGIRE